MCADSDFAKFFLGYFFHAQTFFLRGGPEQFNQTIGPL